VVHAVVNERYDGIEAFHLPTHVGEAVLGRARKQRALGRVLARLDRDALRRRQRVRAFAGVDNDHPLDPALRPVMYVFAEERTREAVAEALFAGRIALLGSAAGSLRARGDRDARWTMIGGTVRADREVRLRWHGRAELFVDGESRGIIRGEFRHAIEPGSFHVYRIVRRGSYGGQIYANLPGD
jgi:hypothetical protein